MSQSLGTTRTAFEGQLHGGSSELKFFEAFQSPEWKAPCWWRSLRRATPAEDAQGIDAVLNIDAGTVLLQIKSSVSGLLKEVKHYGNAHCVIIVREGMSPNELRSKAVNFIYRRRGFMLGVFGETKKARNRRQSRGHGRW
jgi:hypothetical protein